MIEQKNLPYGRGVGDKEAQSARAAFSLI